MGTEHKPIIETNGLTKEFGSIVAVGGVNVSFGDDELHALIGPNGAGKTTLFHLLTGVHTPTAGEIYYDGREITDLPPEERSQLGLARSYQSNQLFNSSSVLENVRIAAQVASTGTFSFDLFRDYAGESEEEAWPILEQFALAEQAHVEARNLSHGDQRRLTIAIAMATDPSVLLLDEPTSGMDSGASKQMAATIRDLHDNEGIPIVLVEHNMRVIMDVSDRITVIHNGNLLATDTPEEIRQNETVQEVYLGTRSGVSQ